MQKIALFTLLSLASIAQAHDLWVTAPTEIGINNVLKADLSYSHHYPHAMTIDADRIHIFKPLTIIDSQGKHTNMQLYADNFRYQNRTPLKLGTYRITATYKPTFWAKDVTGKWSQNNLKTAPQSVYCEETQMFGKAIVTVGTQFDMQAAIKPVGQELEIVPLSNPNNLQAKALLPIQVLYQGKPLAGAMVTATSDVLASMDPTAMEQHRDINGYAAKTGKDGKTNFIPLVNGRWKVKVVHETPYTDTAICQKHSLIATLVVPVGSNELPSAHEHGHTHHH